MKSFAICLVLSQALSFTAFAKVSDQGSDLKVKKSGDSKKLSVKEKKTEQSQSEFLLNTTTPESMFPERLCRLQENNRKSSLASRWKVNEHLKLLDALNANVTELDRHLITVSRLTGQIEYDDIALKNIEQTLKTQPDNARFFDVNEKLILDKVIREYDRRIRNRIAKLLLQSGFEFLEIKPREFSNNEIDFRLEGSPEVEGTVTLDYYTNQYQIEVRTHISGDIYSRLDRAYNESKQGKKVGEFQYLTREEEENLLFSSSEFVFLSGGNAYFHNDNLLTGGGYVLVEDALNFKVDCK